MATTLELCKTALRVVTSAYDSEIQTYIDSAEKDLNIAGVQFDEMDDIVKKAIMTYVRMSFGNPENYKELKSAYDEQKAQLQNATGYTVWDVNENE